MFPSAYEHRPKYYNSPNHNNYFFKSVTRVFRGKDYRCPRGGVWRHVYASNLFRANVFVSRLRISSHPTRNKFSNAHPDGFVDAIKTSQNDNSHGTTYPYSRQLRSASRRSCNLYSRTQFSSCSHCLRLDETLTVSDLSNVKTCFYFYFVHSRVRTFVDFHSTKCVGNKTKYV